ncbi:hypothetical protein D3C75_763700 [compost metagenome]
MLLPRNEYLLTHQAALTPNTRFSGTEINTAMTVSFRADSASGSKIAVKNAPRPSFRPWDTTMNSGSNRNSAKISQPRPIRIRREVALPRRAAFEEAAAIDDWDMGAPPYGVSMRRCNKLISSNRTKETTSISTPMEVAPV